MPLTLSYVSLITVYPDNYRCSVPNCVQWEGALYIKATNCMLTMRYNIWVRPGVTVVTLQDYIHRTTKRVSLKTQAADGETCNTACVCMLDSGPNVQMYERACECYCILKKVVLAYGFALCTLTLLLLNLCNSTSPMWPCFNIWSLNRTPASTPAWSVISVIRDTLRPQPPSC